MDSPTTSPSLPNWVILDRYVFRRDSGSFRDDDNPTAASGVNSRGDKFRVWFKLDPPPQVTRLYMELAAGAKDVELEVVASHGDVVLLQMMYMVSGPGGYIYRMVDYFLYRAGGSRPSLELLPPLGGTMNEIEARIKAKDYRLTNQRLRRGECLDIGVLCHGEEIAVAELQITGSKVGPELHVFYPSRSSNNWEVKKPEIIVKEGFNLDQFLWEWDADTVIAFGNYICWIDYALGMLLCDLFDDGDPKLRFVELPVNLPGFHRVKHGRWVEAYETVGVTKDGSIRFVMVVRDDGKIYEYFPPTSGFTVYSWTLSIDKAKEMVWNEGAVVKSSSLWTHISALTTLPQDLMEFPIVSMDDSDVVLFILRRESSVQEVEFPIVSMDDSDVVLFILRRESSVQKEVRYDETWLLAIDLRSVTLKSYFQYINLKEEVNRTQEEVDFAKFKHRYFKPFLPAEFSRHLKLHGTSACKDGTCHFSVVSDRCAPK